MHCILDSIKSHLLYYGEQSTKYDTILYHAVRFFAGNRGPTFAGLVPFICRKIATAHKLNCVVEVDPYWDKCVLLAQASRRECLFVNMGQIDYSDEITSGAGMYCNVTSGHASFVSTPPFPKAHMKVTFY